MKFVYTIRTRSDEASSSHRVVPPSAYLAFKEIFGFSGLAIGLTDTRVSSLAETQVAGPRGSPHVGWQSQYQTSRGNGSTSKHRLGMSKGISTRPRDRSSFAFSGERAHEQCH
ncbi:hypothetical protein IG631_06044 [Alternaria alternata]|nr:hypothetical protein IG631_06044 [Alternaria alternata]